MVQKEPPDFRERVTPSPFFCLSLSKMSLRCHRSIVGGDQTNTGAIKFFDFGQG